MTGSMGSSTRIPKKYEVEEKTEKPTSYVNFKKQGTGVATGNYKEKGLGNFTGKVNTYERPQGESDEDEKPTSSMIKKSSYSYG